MEICDPHTVTVGRDPPSLQSQEATGPGIHHHCRVRRLQAQGSTITAESGGYRPRDPPSLQSQEAGGPGIHYLQSQGMQAQDPLSLQSQEAAGPGIHYHCRVRKLEAQGSTITAESGGCRPRDPLSLQSQEAAGPGIHYHCRVRKLEAQDPPSLQSQAGGPGIHHHCRVRKLEAQGSTITAESGGCRPRDPLHTQVLGYLENTLNIV
ncbi:hypothetical protein JOB18_020755 [Solea senegalensis]|uniref:Uncharacterized protein n=1 Tax=Solea senegalensis TaxID=28829 RepID=A0AAV6PU98_SOLSE|nr:hypothetical protein JOB18_020755 [Solea senegalensis]